VGGSLQGGRAIQPVAISPGDQPENALSARDARLSKVISAQSDRWPSAPSEDPIWGLVRIIIAQQVATEHACRIADRLTSAFPGISFPDRQTIPTVSDLRAFGLPERRAKSCIEVLKRSDWISRLVSRGATWEFALNGIKGVGPWTLSTFRIMVLREPDVLPLGDVGLERAIRNIYGSGTDVEQLAENWRPFRSVACWYLWRTLGNRQLG
jgi:DNA-3-methyladenine glycosylase II